MSENISGTTEKLQMNIYHPPADCLTPSSHTLCFILGIFTRDANVDVSYQSPASCAVCSELHKQTTYLHLKDVYSSILLLFDPVPLERRRSLCDSFT